MQFACASDSTLWFAVRVRTLCVVFERAPFAVSILYFLKCCAECPFLCLPRGWMGLPTRYDNFLKCCAGWTRLPLLSVRALFQFPLRFGRVASLPYLDNIDL